MEAKSFAYHLHAFQITPVCKETVLAHVLWPLSAQSVVGWSGWQIKGRGSQAWGHCHLALRSQPSWELRSRFTHSGAARGSKRDSKCKQRPTRQPLARAPPPPPASASAMALMAFSLLLNRPVLGPQALSSDGSAQLPAGNSPSQELGILPPRGRVPARMGCGCGDAWGTQRAWGPGPGACLPTNKCPFV